MKRAIFVLMIFILHGSAVAAATDVSPAPRKLQCESRAPGYDSMEVKCPLEPSAAAQRYRFKVNFSGGHDDTKASIAPALNGAPLVCGEGSKTSLFGEDGEVSLECRFSIAAKSAAGQAFDVLVSWSHAQYTDFEFYLE